MRTLRLLPFVFAFVTGCSSPPPADVPAGCNPLIGDDCATPFPSSFYEVADADLADRRARRRAPQRCGR